MQNAKPKSTGRKGAMVDRAGQDWAIGRTSVSQGFLPEMTSARLKSNAEADSASEVVDSDGQDDQVKNSDNEANLLRDMGLLNSRSEAICCGGTNHLNQQAYDEEYSAVVAAAQKQVDEHFESVLEVREIEPMDKLLRLPENTLREFLIKSIRLIARRVSLACQIVAFSKAFESLALLVILANTVMMVVTDPLVRQTSPADDLTEKIFLGFYLLEMTLKIVGSGFVFNEGAYLRNYWNILDFFVVITNVLPLLTSGIPGVDVDSLKAMSVLRPLRVLTKIDSLKMIVGTLFASLPLVVDSIILLLVVVVAFSVLGIQLFGNGELNKHCFDASTGAATAILCGTNLDCSTLLGANGESMLCARTIQSPNFSFESFDGFGWSFANIFQLITMEGWSTIMYDLQKTTGPVAFFFCVSLLLICSMIFLNITLAILKNKYSEQKKKKKQAAAAPTNIFSIQTLKRLKIFASISHLNETTHKRISADYGAAAARKKLQATGQPSKLPVRHRHAFKSSKVHMLVPKPRWDSIRGCQANASNGAANATEDVQASQASESILPGIKTIKSIRSMRDIRSTNKLPSIKTMQVFEQSINDIIYRGRNTQPVQEGQLSVIESIESTSSAEEIETEKAIEEGQNYNFEAIQAVERNKYLFELLKIEGKANATSQLCDKIRRKLESLAPPKIVEEANFPIFNELDLFKTARGFFQLPVPSNKKPSAHLNGAPTAVRLEINSKATVVTEKTLQEMKHEQELEIEDMKIINVVRRKQLMIVFKKDSSVLSEANLQAIKRILKSNHIASRRDRSIQLIRKCAVSYWQDCEEHQQSRLEHRVLKIPECQHTARTNRIGDSPDRKTSNLDVLETAKQLESMRLRNQEFSRKLKFKVRFQPVRSESASPYTEEVMSPAELNEQCFHRQAIERKVVEATSKGEKRIEEPSDIASYQQLKLSYSQMGLTKSELYDKAVDHLQTKPTLRMRSPADEILQVSPVLSSSVLSCSQDRYCIWIPGFGGFIQIIRNRIRKIVLHTSYDAILFLLVLFNTIVLCLNGLVDTSNEDTEEFMTKLNKFFTMAFLADVVLKILSFGVDFVKDYMNIFNLVVVIGGVVEINQTGSSNLTAFKSIKILKALRVLRITRLIPGMRFMSVITKVIASVSSEFLQIFLLLSLFMLVYVLMGMRVFGGSALPMQISGIRQNFNSFFESLVTVFQVLTVENWNDIQTLIFLSSSSNATLIYLVSWIVIGNWVLLNLLQAVLIDGFDLENSKMKALKEELQMVQEKSIDSEISETGSMSLQSHHNSRLTLFLTRSSRRVDLCRSAEPLNETRRNSYSLFVFAPRNRIREWCRILVDNNYFEWVILAIIFVSCGKLIFDTYDFPPTIASQLVDYSVSILFLVEFLLKIVHRGMFTTGGYFEDAWNKLDFFIILSTLIDLGVSANLSFVKVLRVLRPLRMISKNSKVKIIIQSLGESIPALANVSLLLFLVFLIFTVLFVNFLQGKLDYCDMGKGPTYGPYNISRSDCSAAGGVWRTQDINFDNVYRGLLSMYVMATRQNWPYYYYSFVDADDQGPIRNNNPGLFFFLIVTVILICSYFLQNMFSGVLFINYRMSEAKNNPRILTEKQKMWVDLQKLIVRKDPRLPLYIQPKSFFRRVVWKALTSKVYTWIFAILTVLNIVLYLFGEGEMKPSEKWRSDLILDIFQVLFSVEFAAKLLAYGISKEIFEIKNFIDVVTLFLALVNMFLRLPVLKAIVVFGRILRFMSLLRLLRWFKTLQRLIDTVLGALPALINVLLVLGLFVSVSAVLISSFFGTIVNDPYGFITEQRNFSNFHQSFQLLFVCLTGENWYYYMFATMNAETQCVDAVTGQASFCGSSLYILFWLPFIFIGQKIVMELFVMVVLQQFQSSYIHENNPIGLFDCLSQDFAQKWVQCCEKDPTKQSITREELVKLCLTLKAPLGLGKEEAVKELESELARSKQSELETTKKLYHFLSHQRQAAVKWVRGLKLSQNNLRYHRVFYAFAQKALTAQAKPLNSQQSKTMAEAQEESHRFLAKIENKKSPNKECPKTYPLVDRLFNQIVLNAWCRYTELKNSRRLRTNEGLSTVARLDTLQDSVLVSYENLEGTDDTRLVELRDQKRPNLERRDRNSRASRISQLHPLRSRTHNIPNTDNYEKQVYLSD